MNNYKKLMALRSIVLKRRDRWLFRKWYSIYLNTSHWKGLKKKVMARAGWTCEYCECENAKHVHHKTYKNVGMEKLEDLEALCVLCHENKHNIKSFGGPNRIGTIAMNLYKTFGIDKDVWKRQVLGNN